MQNKGCLNFNCRAKVLSICKHISISNTLPRLTLALAILLRIMGVGSTDHFVENLDVGSWGVKNDV